MIEPDKMSSKDVKVIIVGGSIAGLSLALMLEKNGIDFLVLEGYPSIAPQVGASIGVLPNGLRILDQLGCCNEVIAAAEYPVDKVTFRNSKGQTFWSFENFNQQMVGRFVISTSLKSAFYINFVTKTWLPDRLS
jgi:2-polyprenyl-6-methoxyphenol hydroxylase-like FAD-dependent oxidoreductase